MGYGGGGSGGGGSGGGGGGSGSSGSGGSGASGGSGYRRVGDDRTANIKADNITSRDGSSGTDVDGIVKVNTTAHFIPPSGTTAERGSRGRGVVAGGYSAPAKNNVMDIVTIATLGNATSFGNLTTARSGTHSCSSSTRMVICGGYAPSTTNVMEYVSISSGGNTFDFGDYIKAIGQHTGCSNEIRGIFSGGTENPGNIDNIAYITIATKGDASEFGQN